jgi:hypothetical protein
MRVFLLPISNLLLLLPRVLLQAESDGASEKSRQSQFVEIDLSSRMGECQQKSTPRRSSQTYLDIAQALMGNKRDTLLKIVESDDESWMAATQEEDNLIVIVINAQQLEMNEMTENGNDWMVEEVAAEDWKQTVLKNIMHT